LAAVMERTEEPELVKHGSEEISNQSSQIHDVIAHRAFDIFESRGGSPGHELEDWFRAESELLRPVPLNVTESDDEYIVRAEVPGFGSKEIRVIVEPLHVVISGKRKTSEDEENGKTICSGRGPPNFPNPRSSVSHAVLPWQEQAITAGDFSRGTGGSQHPGGHRLPQRKSRSSLCPGIPRPSDDDR